MEVVRASLCLRIVRHTTLSQAREAARKNARKAENEDGVNRFSVYKRYMLDKVLRTGSQDAMLILPITSQIVDYHDVPAEFAPLFRNYHSDQY